ncbi:DUF3095 domain-containing protein [Aestuariivita boseongensis]|uniref:DUF3095 domain-containing protein n=1 Tax=Aestuariivita boseongensis TaxID=1470562 RepID=UPI000682DAEA|nr:DUF3095 domain-containing protein [Aestuariivita boseongensis]
MSGSEPFFDDLPPCLDFRDLADPKHYAALPGDWLVGVSDIVQSTQLVDAGMYKTVNMVGAAVISAVMNALGGRSFPFIFGGDGAGFAIWPGAEESVADALSATVRWAKAEFDITLRAALVPASDCAAAGHPVRVAKYQASPHAQYAMFAGGGLSWAEAQMKSGRYGVLPAPEGALPDLTGLSCRWSHMTARNGLILSLVAVPADGAGTAFTQVAAEVIALAYPLELQGHPVPAEGPGTSWPPSGAMLEAHAQRGNSPLKSSYRKVLFETFLAWLLIRLGAKLGSFDPRRYARLTGENADFRKFEDGLKMTIDCDAGTRDRIVHLLEQAREDGFLRYGISEQAEAMMTCIVPSVMQDDHVHFIDGAAGGYTLAASRMKAR